jgi:hypothetical protein
MPSPLSNQLKAKEAFGVAISTDKLLAKIKSDVAAFKTSNSLTRNRRDASKGKFRCL